VRRRRISAAQSRSHTSRANHNPFASKVSLKLEPERGKLPFIEEVGRRIILGCAGGHPNNFFGQADVIN
jgi:hypothetical protein